MTRVAAIDCGTNSIRLLVADIVDGVLTDLTREMLIVRLGQGVDRTGRLSPDAIDRTRVALAEYAATIERLGAERVRMVATSATRDAANRQDFVDMVVATLGHEPEVITGGEEADLSATGAVRSLPGRRPPVLIADIGGGSTELILADPATVGVVSHSMDVGCVRMTERHLHDDPPTPAQIEETVSDLRAAIAAAPVPIKDARTFIGVAGTVTTLAALVHGLPEYDPLVIHGLRMSAAQVAEITERLLAMSHEQRAALPVMHPGRVDVIGGGALVLRTLMEESGASEVIASEHDILDGIAYRLAE